MTQKRLERLENQASQQRASQTRNSTKRVRSSTRRSKNKKKEAESSLGMVSFPVFDPKMSKSNSTLNKDAEAFVPASSKKKSPSKWAAQIDRIHDMGFPAPELKIKTLLDKYNGDVERTIEDLLSKKSEKANNV